MNLFEMNTRVKQLIDMVFESANEETGEVDDQLKTELDAAILSREERLDNIGVYIKNLTAEAAALKAEEDSLAARRKSKETKIKHLKDYVTAALLSDGQMNFETARVAYSFRKSTAVEITGDVPKKYMVKTVTEKPDKTAIGKALNDGLKVRGAEIVTRQNLQIK